MGKDRLQDRLNSIRSHVVGDAPAAPGTSSAPARYLRLAEALKARLIENPSGSFCLSETTYEFGYRLGTCVLEPPVEDCHLPLSYFSAGESDEHLQLSNALFFDTETTGLGGSGAVAFLIGFGSLTERGFEVRQYVLPDYSDETALLEEVFEEFKASDGLVSYNGLAFDINLVRDRMIVNRVARDVPHTLHVDLLHSARRLFRRRLGDCSLTNIEREIFSFYREDDIPGYLIPAVFFEWLASEETDDLEKVLEHNRWDILTLYFLLHRVAETFAQDGANLEHADDVYSLSRVYGRRKRNDKVVDLYQRLGERPDSPLAPDILLYHSMAFKRTGDWSAAVELWQRLSAGTGREAFEAGIELAKYFEHRVKQPDQALQYARLAGQKGAVTKAQQQDLRRRLSRLSAKMKQ